MSLASTASALARFAPSDSRPALGSHLVIRRQTQMGEVFWMVKNTETAKYYKFSDADWGLIEMFDGTRTVGQIREEYNRRIPGADVTLDFVLEYEDMLREFEMLEQRGMRRHLALVEKFKTARKRAAEERAEGFNPFFLLFKVFDPNRFLDRTVRYVRWVWTPPTVIISSFFFLFTIAVFMAHWAPIWAGTIELYAFLRKPFLDAVQFFCILTIIGAIHEFGHGYATKIYGGEVHDMGIALLYFTPAFYCDTSDSLLFENKWHQLWVTIAGIYVEAFLCSAATITWVASYPDTLVHELAYKTMLFTGISTVFFNINPLIKIDGYHALSSVLEIPELREESFRYLGALFQRHVLRLDVEVPAATRRRRRIYWIYGPLALLYVGSIMAFVGKLFFNFYSRYFPELAVVLLIVTLAVIFKKRVRLTWRILRLFVTDKKEWIMSPRMRKPLLLTGTALLLVLAIPWPRRVISADAVLKPLRTLALQAPADGSVREVRAAEGERVNKGDVILALDSGAVQYAVDSLSAESRMFAADARRHRAGADAAELFRSEQREHAAERALAKGEADRERLQVRSPIAGVVLTPRLRDLRSKFVRAGTLLGTVGDCRTMKAELLISERMLVDVFPGARVSLQLDSRPWQILHGTIASISPSTPDAARIAGSSAALRPPSEPDRFVAVAVFDNASETLLPEMEGRVKIFGKRASYLEQLARGTRRWIQSMVW
ncbi:MAG TPA: HlyD family efflux transporter periplasmic adaptor subunit [Thermoanaerobaculia bacterium]|nr:HlyD family efflux transporter periplasmic adaptor subunit [Thermoanaerobaculia bacterium]